MASSCAGVSHRAQVAQSVDETVSAISGPPRRTSPMTIFSNSTDAVIALAASPKVSQQNRPPSRVHLVLFQQRHQLRARVAGRVHVPFSPGSGPGPGHGVADMNHLRICHGVDRQASMLFYANDETVWASRAAVARLMDISQFVARFAHTRAVTVDPDPIINACLSTVDLRPWTSVIRSVVGQVISGHGGFDRRTLMKLVGRLAETAETHGETEMRQTALDAWDLMIEAGWHEAVEWAIQT